MTIELIIGVAVGYIPCECNLPQRGFSCLTLGRLVIDNFGLHSDVDNFFIKLTSETLQLISVAS